MVLEGATPRQVDSALEEWGMAMGILAVFDMAGIDVGVNVHKANASQFPPDPQPTTKRISHSMTPAACGQKNGKGYYRYEPGNRARFDDPEALARFSQHRARQLRRASSVSAFEGRDSSERCLYPLLERGSCAFSEKAWRCVPRISMWFGLRATASRAIAAADVLRRVPIGLEDAARRASRKYQRHFRSDALATRAAVGGAGGVRALRIAQWEALQRGASGAMNLDDSDCHRRAHARRSVVPAGAGRSLEAVRRSVGEVFQGR